ncbi:MAG: hypothetical protein ACM3MI_15830 [Clostridiales bacterium]
MINLEVNISNLKERVDTDIIYKASIHLEESAILLYVDSLMAGKMVFERELRHLKECIICKGKALKYFNFYGFDELKLK